LSTATPRATVGHAQSALGKLTSGNYDGSLLTTVSVGSALLAVNVLVLLCVCYHRKVRSQSPLSCEVSPAAVAAACSEVSK